MISPRQKPAGSAYLLVCRFAQAPSAALQRAELLRGVGSSVLVSAPREPAGGRAACPQLLRCCRGCGCFIGAGGQERSAPAWQKQGGWPLGNRAAEKCHAAARSAEDRSAEAPQAGLGCLVLGRA